MGLFKVSALLCSLLVCVSAGGGGYSRGYGGYGGYDGGYGDKHAPAYGRGHGAGYPDGHGPSHNGYGYGGGYGDGHKGYGGDGYHGSGYGGYGYGEHRPKPAMEMSVPHGEPYVNKFAVPKPHPAYGLTHAKRSCIDHYKPGAKNGYYRVFAMHPTTSIMVYCDFTSEPGMAYTMVMSSSAAGRAAVAEPHEVQKSLLDDSPVNAGQPNNVSYRLGQADMKNILSASSVWRLMCTELDVTDNKPTGHVNPIFSTYIRAKKDDYKLFETESEGCDKVEYARLPGNGNTVAARSCSHCTVPLTQGAPAAGDFSVHIAATGGSACTINEDEDNTVNNGIGGYFGGAEAHLNDACAGTNNYIQLWFGRPY